MTLRSALVVVAAALPAGALKNFLLRRLGWRIGDDVYIGPCLFVNVDRVELGDGAALGAGNVVRDLSAFTLGEHAILGHWNWLSAARPLRAAGGPGAFHLGAHSAITSRHYFACSGGVTVGVYTSIGGVRSTFITHQISWKECVQTFRPIDIGDYCLVTSNVHVAPGTTIGDRVIVGMGATIAGKLLDPGLYIQSRATLVKPDLVGEYFERANGYVGAAQAPR